MSSTERQLKDWAEFSDKQAQDWEAIVEKRDEYIATLGGRIREMESELVRLADSPESKPIGAKERESLLKLVIGMAIGGYGYDPEAKRSEQPQAIADDLVKQSIPLDVDTVRKWLKTGAELLPSDRK